MSSGSRILVSRKAVNMDKLNYTFSEFCEVAQASAPTVRGWIRRPDFPAWRVGRQGRKILIPCELAKKWLEEQAMRDIDRT